MRISRSSWHYRMQRLLYSLWAEGPDVFKGARAEIYPKSLCSYFWVTVLLIVSMPMWAMAALFVTIVVFFISPPRLHLVVHPDDGDDEKVAEEKKPKKPKKEPLVRNYLKARKEKVCPRIELVD